VIHPPTTFYDCLALMLVLLWALAQGGGGGRLPADVNTLNVRRCAGGRCRHRGLSARHDLGRQ
jgi:hypothetical protein